MAPLGCMCSAVAEVRVRTPVFIPFVCPICTGANAVELIPLSRAGGMNCIHCQKRLKSSDVMRAMHSPRKPLA